jgi:simple sugar transport system permease protein
MNILTKNTAKPVGEVFSLPSVAWRREWITFGLIVILCVFISILNPNFLQVQTVFDLLRAITVPGIFALGVFVVLAAGGIDVSFPAIAAAALYLTATILLKFWPDAPLWLAFLISGTTGILLGVINGILVDSFKVPSLIVTIGTQYLVRGALLAFIGAVWLNDLPTRLDAFGKATLISFTSEQGITTSLPVIALVLLVIALVTWFILNRTLMGRAIFAVGGNLLIAERLGFSIRKVHLFVFGYAGLLAGIGGLVHSASTRIANPFALAGTELDIIAAVVLGGANIEGGKGSVVGTLLGVVLVQIVNTSLILVGVPSTWQRIVVGLIVLVSSGIFSLKIDVRQLLSFQSKN